MARLFGFIGNRFDLGSRILDVDAAALTTRAQDEHLGWGVGFYQAGEVLLRRRPVDDREVIEPASLTKDVLTDALIGNIRGISFGEPRTQNTQPFRYRNWIFAHHGTVNRFERLRDRLTESIPDFLRRNVRGETDSELVFYLYLSFLYDAGKLRGPTPPMAAVDALRGTRALLDRLAREEGAQDAGPIGILVSDGELLAGISRGVDMAYRPVRGENDIEALFPEDGLRHRHLPDMAHVRFTIVASGFSEARPGWTKLPERSTVVLGRLDEPSVDTF